MARTYLVFGDIGGKLDVLRVECARCQRKGRYSVRRLIEKYGRNANMMKGRSSSTGTARNGMHPKCTIGVTWSAPQTSAPLRSLSQPQLRS